MTYGTWIIIFGWIGSLVLAYRIGRSDERDEQRFMALLGRIKSVD